MRYRFSMLTLEEARAAILAEVTPAAMTETTSLARAHGRFVARELRAQVDNPAFDNSAMDGYALRVADLLAAGYALPRRGECRCGDARGVWPPARRCASSPAPRCPRVPIPS